MFFADKIAVRPKDKIGKVVRGPAGGGWCRGKCLLLMML